MYNHIIIYIYPRHISRRSVAPSGFPDVQQIGIGEESLHQLGIQLRQ